MLPVGKVALQLTGCGVTFCFTKGPFVFTIHCPLLAMTGHGGFLSRRREPEPIQLIHLKRFFTCTDNFCCGTF